MSGLVTRASIRGDRNATQLSQEVFGKQRVQGEELLLACTLWIKVCQNEKELYRQLTNWCIYLQCIVQHKVCISSPEYKYVRKLEWLFCSETWNWLTWIYYSTSYLLTVLGTVPSKTIGIAWPIMVVLAVANVCAKALRFSVFYQLQNCLLLSRRQLSGLHVHTPVWL